MAEMEMSHMLVVRREDQKEKKKEFTSNNAMLNT